MAEFDQPALWEFVLSKTNQKKLTYIGHSQGTTQMFAALCNNGDFFKPKVNGYILIAPVTRVQNMMSPWCQKMKADKKAFDFF
jgi:pimeloyl-ACP methyl ester carboxylesterase